MSPNLTPQAKKSQRIMSGSGRPTKLFKKETTINVDEEIEMDIVEEKKSHISSENEVIFNKNIKDSNLKDVFQCVVCKRIPREPFILEKCGHYCCRVCLYSFKKISKKCPKCGKTFAIDTIVRLPKEVKHLYQNITVTCQKCKKEMTMEESNTHKGTCHGKKNLVKIKLTCIISLPYTKREPRKG